MVLATRSKNISSITKIIIICLSVLLAALSSVSAFKVLDTAIMYNLEYSDFNGKELNKSLCDNSRLKYKLDSDIMLFYHKMNLINSEELKNKALSKRDSYINEVTAEYQRAKANRNEYGNDYFYYTYEFSIDDYDFSISLDEGENSNAINLVSDSEEVAKDKIVNSFDSFVNSYDYSPYVMNMNVDSPTGDLKYYVCNSDGSKEISNMDKDHKYTEAEILAMDYAFVVKSGEVKTSKGFENVFGNCDDNYFINNWIYYAYVDTNDSSYSGYNSIMQGTKKVEHINLLKETVLAVLFAAIGLALAIVSFVFCGRKEDGKTKLEFIDYVPTDLHIALTVAAQAALVIMGANIYDTVSSFSRSYDSVLYLALYAITALIWALCIECVSSFIRVCKSEKQLYKNTLVYIIIKHLIVIPAKRIRTFFSYSPNVLQKSTKKLLIGYISINAAILLLAIIFAVFGVSLALPLFFVAEAALNISAGVYTSKYLKQLDTIITASFNRQQPVVEYNKLPESLKTLVNSLNYTSIELKNAVEKAVRDERMRTELITNVSHDLKTPLTSVINYVDLLKGCDIEDKKAKEYIVVLDEQGKKLKRLIDDLIEASKITSGVINIELININLSELATQAVVEHQQEFSNNGLELVFKGDKKNISAFADGSKTYRIIENLISNARKYSLKGTRVYSDVYETENYSIFEIKNTSAEQLDISVNELKERFVRGDKSRTNEGNGLGLSIADNLCKAQGGHLNITIDGDLFKVQVMLPKAKN